MIQALILDFDGLIIDSEVAVAGSWRGVFEGYGLDFPEDLWRQMVGTREHDRVLWEEIERLTGRQLDVAPLETARRARSAAAANRLRPLPGVVELLDQAASLGLALSIASSSSAEWVRGHLDRLSLLGRFAVICTKEDAPRSKPDPGVYLAAVSRLGVEANAAVAFEDSAPGVAAATAAGLWTVAVPGSYTEHMDFSAADVVLDSLCENELSSILERFER